MLQSDHVTSSHRRKYAQEYFAENVIFDVASSTDIPNTDMNKVYMGHDGVLEYCIRLAEFEWSNMKLSTVAADASSVLVKWFATAKNKATGRQADLTTFQEVRFISLRMDGCIFDGFCWKHSAHD